MNLKNMCSLFILLIAFGNTGQAKSAQTVLYVAQNGNDKWSGRMADATGGDGPFATLERARDEIRKIKREKGLPERGVSVQIREGVYELKKTFQLNEEDSGTEISPITYRAYKGEKVRLTGGRKLTIFEPVKNPLVLARLPRIAREKVLESDLGEVGISDLGVVHTPCNWPCSSGDQRLELFFDSRPMILARWPNKGFIRILEPIGVKPQIGQSKKGDETGNITYAGNRPKRWALEKDMWAHGYWFWDWADEREKISHIDTKKRVISLAPYHRFGYKPSQGYYVFNVLAELDTPSEWYLDRTTKVLYFWPPVNPLKARISVSMLSTAVEMNNASYISLEGFVIDVVRGTAVRISGGVKNKIVACVIRNTGSWGVEILGGRMHGIVRSKISETGDGGVFLRGGKRVSLTSGMHYVKNNSISHFSRWNWTYQPGIRIEGVGNRVAHNEIHDAPHQAISFSGNNHMIEYNRVYKVCLRSNDVGAIYAGRDWSMRGTVIRYNYFKDINGLNGSSAVGIYLDDMFSGTRIFGNIFFRVSRPILIGGGRDNIIENNIFVEPVTAIHIDARGLTWAKGAVNSGLPYTLGLMPFQQPLWSKRYPALTNIIDNEAGAPMGNIIARNINLGKRWIEITSEAKRYVTVSDNLVDQDPKYFNAHTLSIGQVNDLANHDIAFVSIPTDKIGIH